MNEKITFAAWAKMYFFASSTKSMDFVKEMALSDLDESDHTSFNEMTELINKGFIYSYSFLKNWLIVNNHV